MQGGACAAGEELNEHWPHLRSRLSKWSASCSGDTRKSSKGCWYRNSKDPSLPLLASSWLELSPARSRRDEALKRFISPFSCLDEEKKCCSQGLVISKCTSCSKGKCGAGSWLPCRVSRAHGGLGFAMCSCSNSHHWLPPAPF